MAWVQIKGSLNGLKISQFAWPFFTKTIHKLTPSTVTFFCHRQPSTVKMMSQGMSAVWLVLP